MVNLLPETLKLLHFPIFLTMSVPDESYSRNMSCALYEISTFLCDHKYPKYSGSSKLLFPAYYYVQQNTVSTF